MRAAFLCTALLFASLAFAEFNITEIREFDASGFSGYPEIGEIRQNTLLAYYSQGKESLPAGFAEFSSASLDFMKKFGGAYMLSATEDPEQLLKLPGEIGFAAGSLQKMEELGSNSIPLSKYSAYLARTATERYITAQAERLRGLAEAEAQTRKKLAYYEAAAGVYGYSVTGVRAAEMRATRASINALYKSEMGKADSVFDDSKNLCRSSIESSGEWFGLAAYVGLRRCTDGMLEARKTYSAHVETEKLQELDSELGRAERTKGDLSSRVFLFFISLCLFFLLINWIFIHQVRRWREDDYDSSLGSEVLKWKGRA